MVSVSGVDRIVLDINGKLFEMPVAVAKVLLSDLRAGVKRVKDGE